MIKSFLKFVKESLDSKNYKWVKSEFPFRKEAIFKTKNKKIFHVCFDEISSMVYNLHFYQNIDGKEIITLTKTGEEFQIIGNVKNIIFDFLTNYKYGIEFIGYSSYEYERNDLYIMLQNEISSFGFNSYRKKHNKITYYFSNDSDIPQMVLDRYEKQFIENDEKSKQN